MLKLRGVFRRAEGIFTHCGDQCVSSCAVELACSITCRAARIRRPVEGRAAAKPQLLGKEGIGEQRDERTADDEVSFDHHLRELQALVDIEKKSWSEKMQRLLRRACHVANIARLGSYEHRELQKLLSVFKNLNGRSERIRTSGPCVPNTVL